MTDERIPIRGDDPSGLRHYDITPHLKRVNLKKFPAGSLVVIGPRGGVRWANASQVDAGVVQPDGTVLFTWRDNAEQLPATGHPITCICNGTGFAPMASGEKVTCPIRV